MIAKTEQEIEALKKIGKIVAEIREAMKEATVPGKTTKEIDDIGGRLFEEKGAISGPIAEYDFLDLHASASTVKLPMACLVPAS